MKLLVFSLLLCGAWAQTQDPADPPQDNADVGEVGEVGEGANEAVGDGVEKSTVEKSTGYWQMYYGRRFMFQATLRTWAHAQQHCQTLGGSLASIHTRGQEAFVKERVAKGRDAWIGLTDAQQDGFWFWVNGDRLRYTNWCRGEPNNAGGPQECVVINFSDYKCWDDERCSVKRPYVCQK